MSSMYRLLCLTHDPAIVLDEEWHSGSGGCERAVAAIAEPPAAHALCDLLVGRYSYPLVEVCCPPSPQGGDTRSGHRGWHRDGQWVDAAWLRLLWLAHQAEPGTPLADAAGRAPGCWTPQRVQRLRYELDLVRMPED